jgi:2-phospho-L-lactate guanylyltransferase
MKAWAVVPVKPFAEAKQRLAGLLPACERAELSRLMLQDTLQALARVQGLAGRLVVTADAQAAALALALNAMVLPEGRPLGLNPAVALAAADVQRRGGDALLVVPGDVPGLEAAQLSALIAAHAGAGWAGGALSLVPAHDGDGTNAWLLSPPLALAPAFGPGSFERHQRDARAAGLELRCLVLPGPDLGLRLDLDHAGDLQRFLAEPRHRATRTARYLLARQVARQVARAVAAV